MKLAPNGFKRRKGALVLIIMDGVGPLMLVKRLLDIFHNEIQHTINHFPNILPSMVLLLGAF